MRVISGALAIVLLLSSCTSTTVDYRKKVRGTLLSEEVIGPEVKKRSVSLSIVGTQVKIVENLQIREGHEKTYSVVRKVRYKDVVDASMLEPLTWPLIPVCGVIGIVTLFLVKLDCILNLKFRSYRVEETVLPGQVKRDRNVRTKKVVRPVAGQEVLIERRGKTLATLTTDGQGVAELDVKQLIREANIHPKHLVHDEGIKLWAVAKGLSISELFRIQNSDIPVSYFQEKLTELQGELQQNEPRLKNCSRIAGNAREMFECFYQRGLIPS